MIIMNKYPVYDEDCTTLPCCAKKHAYQDREGDAYKVAPSCDPFTECAWKIKDDE